MDSFLFWVTVVLGGCLAIGLILALILSLHLRIKRGRERETTEEADTPTPPKKDRWWVSGTAIAALIYLILWGVAGYLIPHVLAAFSFVEFAILFFSLPLIVWVWKKPNYGKGLAIFAGMLLLVMLFQTWERVSDGVNDDFGSAVAAITGYNTEIAGQSISFTVGVTTEVPLNGFQCGTPAKPPAGLKLTLEEEGRQSLFYRVTKTDPTIDARIVSLPVWRFNKVDKNDCKGSAVTLAPFFQPM